MSDELTQLRARVANLEENNRLLKLDVRCLETLAGGAMTELSRREEDTKPMADPADVALVEFRMQVSAWGSERDAWSRIRQALHTQADKSPIPDQGATPFNPETRKDG